jgi:hypothetical protein
VTVRDPWRRARRANVRRPINPTLLVMKRLRANRRLLDHRDLERIAARSSFHRCCSLGNAWIVIVLPSLVRRS